MDKLIPLPPWIMWSKGLGHYVTIEPIKCTLCGYEWYPRIKNNGAVILPVACANNGCRTKHWRKIRE